MVTHASARPKIVVCTDLGPAMPLLSERHDIDVRSSDRHCVLDHIGLSRSLHGPRIGDRVWLLQNIAGASGVVVCFQNMVWDC